MPDVHAILAPSASSRWMSCTPSARLEAKFPEKDTPYTREGTIAHYIAQCFLQWLRDGYDYVPSVEVAVAAFRGDEVPHALDYWQEAERLGLDYFEMARVVYGYYCAEVFDEYVSYKAVDKDTLLLIEAPLNLTDFVPEGFGTSDAVIIAGSILNVYDLKYGKGVQVEAVGNSQMMCYAIGALRGPAELYDIESVRMTILQPRLSHISEWTVSAAELTDWAKNRLAPAAALAFKGEGAYVPGEHCRFCKAAAQCAALAAQADMFVVQTEEPELIDDAKLSEMLGKADMLKTYIAKLEDYALQRCLSDNPVKGWKAVEGRSLRRFTDGSAAATALEQAGFSAADYNKPAELRSITDLEKMLGGKRNFTKILGGLLEKPKGKPTLAREDDPRPAYSSDANSEFNSLL